MLLVFNFAAFETIPQVIVQSLLVFGVLTTFEKTNITETDVYFSICCAFFNASFQLLKLKLEAKAVNEMFTHYCLTCLLARIGWIPYHDQIQKVIRDGKRREHLNFAIQYNYPFKLNKKVHYKPKVEFEFSTLTVQLSGHCLSLHVFSIRLNFLIL